MTGRVAIVTGGNCGIGYEVARHLCDGGYDTVLACRCERKGAEAVNKLRREYPNALVECMQLDLASMNSVKDFAQAFLKKKKRLSLLVNNAGMATNFKDLTCNVTMEGFEVTMATNHLGPYLLTNLLRDCIVETASILGDGRIINVSCALHDHENNWMSKGCREVDLENFQLLKDNTYSGLQAYKNSKLCNVLMTYHMATLLHGTKVTCNVIDPGVVPNTQLYRRANKFRHSFNICCLHNALRCTDITTTVKHAGRMVASLAVSEKYEGQTGKYFVDGVEDRSSIESYDRELQQAVWKKSSKLTNTHSIDDGFDDISLS